MNYFIVKDGQQLGPFTVDQLREQGVTPSTPVWAAGFSDWTLAGKVDELQGVLFPPSAEGAGTPPPFGTTPPPNYAAQQGYRQPGYQQPYDSAMQNNTNVCPKTWMAESILVLLFCCLPFGIVGLVFASKVSSLFQQGQYDAAVQASNDAGKWTKIGFFCGLAVVVIYIILFAAGVLAFDDLMERH